MLGVVGVVVEECLCGLCWRDAYGRRSCGWNGVEDEKRERNGVCSVRRPARRRAAAVGVWVGQQECRRGH